MPEYQQPDLQRAARLDGEADAAAVAGDRAAGVADNYVKVSLLLAAVLFLVGIGTTFEIRRLRWGLVAVGASLLVATVVVIVQQSVSH